AIARFSPIMKEVTDFAAKGGYVFGVCNGFQILCEAGLLPGTLLHNLNYKYTPMDPHPAGIDAHPAGFICKNIFIKAEHNDSLISSAIDTTLALHIPIANGAANYYCDKEMLRSLKEKGQMI